MNGIKSCDVYNKTDDYGNPAGGYVLGTGIDIKWQDGPLGRGVGRKEPNGAFVETVIGAAKQRIEYYNSATPFACRENSIAITKLEEVSMWANKGIVFNQEILN